MKQNDTWIKLYRKSLKSSVWKNANIWMVWCWCLMKANHEKNKFPFNGEDIIIYSGQFITGRTKALQELPITAQTYKTCLSYLKSTSRITIKTTNKFSIITIVKWENYQEPTRKLTSKLNNHQPATNQPLTTNKNDKNDKNIYKLSFRGQPVNINYGKHQVFSNGAWRDLDPKFIKEVIEK